VIEDTELFPWFLGLTLLAALGATAFLVSIHHHPPESLTFAQPAWLILLVLLPFWERERGDRAAAAQAVVGFVAPRLRSALVKRGSSLPRWLRCFSCSPPAPPSSSARPAAGRCRHAHREIPRPQPAHRPRPLPQHARPTSSPTACRRRNRHLRTARSHAERTHRHHRFRGHAYVYAPLTVDHRAVRETVEQIDETWAPLGGSDLAGAIELAIETLGKTGQKNNALVIISDGEKHEGDLEAMISEAEKSGVYILAVGVGTEDGDYVPNPDFPGNRMVDRNGKPVISRLQPEVMRKLATETKGRYAVAGTGMDIPEMVKSAIKDLDAFEMEGRQRRISIEFYQSSSIIAGTRWLLASPPFF
jgi:Ca-activated chloride channel homolog